jgi:hypothetical protein
MIFNYIACPKNVYQLLPFTFEVEKITKKLIKFFLNQQIVNVTNLHLGDHPNIF